MIPVICQVLSSFPQAKLANLVQEKTNKIWVPICILFYQISLENINSK